MIYGTPIVHVDDDQTDRIGIRTLVLSQVWQPSRWPLSMEELDAEMPAPPPVSGGIIFIGQQTRRQRGVMRTTWTFEGINGNGKSVTFKDRQNSTDYRFDPGFAEKSLMQLPNIEELLLEFGGTALDNHISWPPLVPLGDSGMTKNMSSGKRNPLYGRETYFSMEGTYSFRYAAVSYGRAFHGVRLIHETGSLPGQPPTQIGDRNWLKAPPIIIRRGPVFEITEVFWLSDLGGWPDALYGKNSLIGDNT